MDVDFLTAHLRPRQTNNDNITISTYHTGIKTDIDIDVLQQVAVKMVVLSIDSYNKLLQTEQIIIEIGDEDVREQVAVHKGFLALRSTYLAQQLDKSGMMEQEGKIQITNVPSSAVKLFVKWCYEGRLHFPFKEGEKVNIAKLSKRKALLIDVWFFCDMYGVAELQNQAIHELCRLFGETTKLLSKDDVHAIIDHTPKDNYHALAQLAIVVLVAQLEADGATQTVGEYEEFFKLFDRFGVTLYTALQIYSNYKVPQKEKTSKAKKFLQECVADKLKVVEAEPPEWVKDLCSNKRRPFAPGEIIEID